MNTIKHLAKTRNIQRKIKAMLNNKGIKATCKAVKSSKGWVVNVESLKVKKPVKMACISSSGVKIPVLYK